MAAPQPGTGRGAEELTALEKQVVSAVRKRRSELIDLIGRLVACDTTSREPGDPPRDEAKLQGLLAQRLQAMGAEVDLWEPPPREQDRHLPALTFEGRPQLAARLGGDGGGRSLLLLGHIDAVSAEPRDMWGGVPFRVREEDGRLIGRGVVDMKGALAAMLFALETLTRLGVRLAGDVVYCAVTDEESSGAGGFAAVERGVRADAALCGEPTGFDTWVACRGSLTPVITVEGRAGHAELAQPHWRDGGAVNAIEKAQVVLAAVKALREEWRCRSDQRHPHLSPGTIVPTIMHAGEWSVTYPSRCEVTCEVTYLPTQADDDGIGTKVEREVREWIERAAAADPWFAEHPLRWSWDGDVVPAEIPDDHPLVGAALGVARDLGRSPRISGFDSWHDGATFIRLAGVPTICLGPGQTMAAHAVDEWVPVDDLVDHAAAVALVLLRWCEVSSDTA